MMQALIKTIVEADRPADEHKKKMLRKREKRRKTREQKMKVLMEMKSRGGGKEIRES